MVEKSCGRIIVRDWRSTVWLKSERLLRSSEQPCVGSADTTLAVAQDHQGNRGESTVILLSQPLKMNTTGFGTSSG